MTVRDHHAATRKWLSEARYGVEIGAFKNPIPGIAPVYVDCFATYAHESCLRDYEGSATSLPFRNSSLDYVASSHLLEHVANPVQAFAEWGRVLRSGGIIYAVIPDRRFTWDRQRPLTSAEHMLDDFARGVGQNDPTHINDFVDGVVWSEFSPQAPESDRQTLREQLKVATAAGHDINIHFHTFEPGPFELLIAAINRARVLPFRLEVLELVDRFPESCPNGFLAVLRTARTGARKRWESWRNSRRARGNAAVPLKPGIKRLPRN